jgi:hypothetical protein
MNNSIEPLELSIRKLKQEHLRKEQRQLMNQQMINTSLNVESTNRNYGAFKDQHTTSAYKQIRQDHRSRNNNMVNATTSSPPELRIKRKVSGNRNKQTKVIPSSVIKKKLVQESHQNEITWAYILEQLGKSRFNPNENRYWGTEPQTIHKLKESKEYDRYIDSI